MEWLEAIRVSTHVKLEYDVDFIIDMLKEALEPFTDFPRNLNMSSGVSNTVDIDIDSD
jgi:L-lactate utilization protein LutC